LVTALVDVNVRSGPGVDYPRIGALLKGETAQVTGRSPDMLWWQIVYPIGSAQGRGWVSARPQYTSAVNVENVPMVLPPPPPPTATPTPTHTSTPQLEPPIIFSFWADRYTITRGEKVTLYWDLANAEAAYLRYDDKERGVVAPGSITLSPKETTLYTLRAYNAAGETIRQLIVTVVPPAPTEVVLDLISAAPLASWTSNLGSTALAWGVLDEILGYAIWRDNPELEDGSRPTRVLETRPRAAPNGDIAGQFWLPQPIRPGDRFRAQVGFLAGSIGNVRFVVATGDSLATATIMSTVADNARDGILRTIDIDLSRVADSNFIWIGVLADEPGGGKGAVWINARIER